MLELLASSRLLFLLAIPFALVAGCDTTSDTGNPVSGTGTSGSAGSAGSSGPTTSGGSGGASSSAGTGSGGAGTSGTAGSGGAVTSGDASADVSTESGRDAIADATTSDAPIVAAFAAEALTIAANYTSWGRVDDEWRWAPFLCRLPLPGVARPSQSDDPTTHGQKLYSVFAKNHETYPNGPHTDQVVVKESWVPEVVTGTDASYSPGSYHPEAGFDSPDADHFYGYAKGEGGVVYRAAAPAGLFIMFKLAPTTPDTDEGWVYATVTTAGQVTSAGRVASCMGCHEVADHERLFGVPTRNF